MGMIFIQVTGSFRKRASKNFSAQEHGHADAVAQAIEFLSKEILPSAINQDHDLQTEGSRPNGTFGRE